MVLLRRCLPILLLVAAAWSSSTSPVRAQSESARFVFADTTLLRDTLDLTFEGLFEMADSMHISPDSLRAQSIRYDLPLQRLVFLADSLGMPVDSVGSVLERERYNPLAAQGERLTGFVYNSSYTITRQSTSWSNSATADLVRGPMVLHNLTNVRIDRIQEINVTSFHRSKVCNTETGYRVTPDLSLGARLNLLKTENDRPGSSRATTNNEFQGSMRAKHDFGARLHAEGNLFGGPFEEPRNSLSTASKKGLGTELDGRVSYEGPAGSAFDFNGVSQLRFGQGQLPDGASFDITDSRWSANGTLSLLSNSNLPIRVNYGLTGDRTERPVTFSLVTPPSGSQTEPDTASIDQLLSEPSGTASVDAAVQLRMGHFGNVNLSGNLDRSTTLNASERKQGYVFERSEGHGRGVSADGQFYVRGWSFDSQYSDARPTDESPRRAPVEVPDPVTGALVPVVVDYREKSTTRTRSLTARATRRLTRRLQFNARGEVTLTNYRFAVTDSSYLAQTGHVPVAPSDPHDDYRQSYRLEAVYTPIQDASTTFALEVSRVLGLYLTPNQSAGNREDRIYRADWLWTYRLMPGLSVNQRNQAASTYTRNIYAPTKNRLSMTFTTVTTLTASLTPRLSMDITHNATYGPNGAYVRSADGTELFNISDHTNDYMLSGHFAYTPIQFFTITLMPTYQANSRDDRTSGLDQPTLRRRTLSFSGGASLNVPVGRVGRLSGTLNRVLDARRDIRFVNGVAQPESPSTTDYWNGVLNFSWRL